MRKLLMVATILMACWVHANAQRVSISGRVLDSLGAPLAGASVREKNSNAGTSADNNGNFTISVKPGATLIISAAGYKEMEMAAKDGLVINLRPGVSSLDEVIVTAQGVRRRPKELGYSVAKVNNEELMVGRSPQLGQALSGKVSGLAVYNVNNSVDPAVKITLRGFRSLTGNNDALVVIDGLPMPPGSQTMLNLINPNDIETISVLKGGQAATLYGSDGVNGALVITTKRGSKGKIKVTYSNATNFERVSFLPDFQDKYGSGSHYAASFGNAAWKPNGLDRMKDNWRSYENQQFGDPFDGSMRPAGRTLEDGTFLELPYSAIDGERLAVWNKGFSTNNQVSFSSGGENSTFYLSAEHNITKGVVPEDESQRTGIRLAGTTESGRLKVGYNAAYVQAKYDRTTFDFYNELINQAAHIPLSDLRDWRNNKFASPNAYYNDYYTNPYFRLDNDRQNYGDANISGNVELNFKVNTWLNLYNKLGAMNNTRNRTNTQAKFIHSDWAKYSAVVPDPWDQDDGAGITRALTDVLGSVYDATSTENIINNEFQLQGNKDFGDFSLKALLGMSVYVRKTKLTEVSSSSIVVPDVYNVANRQGNLGGGEENTEYRKFGYYGDALLGWRDMIFLHASGRYDFTSRFYKPTRDESLYSYFYPSVDVSAILTELLPGIKGDLLNYAKIRGGYSKNANDAITLYGLDLTYPNAGGFPYGNTVGITVGDVLPDNNLEPEFVKSYEIGGEFQFFKNRLNVDFTYYTQKTEGQIVTVKIPNSTGFNNLRLNVGETENYGYEADVKVQILRGRKLNWDINVRYSNNENKVTKLYPGVNSFQLSGYSYAGAYVELNQPYPIMKAISYVREPGTDKIVVNKATGYPLTNGPLKNLGRTIPKHILGLGTKLNYAGFTLSGNFEYRGGHVMYSDLGRQMTFTGSGGWTSQRDAFVVPNSVYLDAATGKYVENTTPTAEAEYAYWVDSYRLIAENFVTKAWFIKLRDINLVYDVPASFTSKTRVFSGVSIGVYGRNLFTVVDDKNQFTDPEYSFTTGNGLGVNNTGQTPPVRQYGFNLNFTFK
jgi:TonB-linked SusC/RagA family outer membrane protein